MSDFFQIKQIDRDRISKAMDDLQCLGEDQEVKNALWEAGSVFRIGGYSRLKKRMKSGESGVTGNLLRSINVRVFKEGDGMAVGFRQDKGGGSHAGWIDVGTKKRFRQRVKGFIKSDANVKKTDTGKVIGNEFWTDTASGDYTTAMDKLYKGIEKAVNRISNRR